MNEAIQKLIPALSQKSIIERKYVRQILQADPGIGEKSIEIAASLADSGFTPAAAAMIIQSVYSYSVGMNRGRGTRIKWFTSAIQSRYANRLDKIKTDYRAFRSFLTDMEEVNEIRDTLNGDGFTISYQAAFLLWELGEDANSISVMISNHCDHLTGYRGSQISMVVKAAIAVNAGKFSEVETALEYMCRSRLQSNPADE